MLHHTLLPLPLSPIVVRVSNLILSPILDLVLACVIFAQIRIRIPIVVTILVQIYVLSPFGYWEARLVSRVHIQGDKVSLSRPDSTLICGHFSLPYGQLLFEKLQSCVRMISQHARHKTFLLAYVMIINLLLPNSSSNHTSPILVDLFEVRWILYENLLLIFVGWSHAK